MSTGISASVDDCHDFVSLLFIAMTPIDCKITNFSLHLLYCSHLLEMLFKIIVHKILEKWILFCFAKKLQTVIMCI